MQRYLVEIKQGKVIFQPSDEFHIQKVMRLRIGDSVIGVYSGQEYLLKILAFSPLACEIISIEENPKSELRANITLFIGLLKKDNLELIIQKTTELGISKIIPFISSRVVKRTEEENFSKKILRFKTIIKEAVEQSGRVQVPEILAPVSFNQIQDLKEEINFFASTITSDWLSSGKKAGSYSMVVGPEGGFSSEEEQCLIDWGFLPMTLGQRILRAETAAIASIAYLSMLIEKGEL